MSTSGYRLMTTADWLEFWNDYSFYIGLAAVTALAAGAVSLIRRNRRMARTPDERDTLILRGVLGLVGGIATALSASGMLRFFAEKLEMHGPAQYAGFMIFESAMLGAGILARINKRNQQTTGIYGKAVWAFACATGFFSSLDARNLPEAVFRYAPPLIAAFFFEHLLRVEEVIREKADPDARSGPRKAVWAILSAFDRLMIRWGWKQPDHLDPVAYTRQRRLATLARAAARYHRRKAGSPNAYLTHRAGRRLDRLFELANERLSFSNDLSVREEYLSMLDVIYRGREGSSPTAVAGRPDPFAYALPTHDRPAATRPATSDQRPADHPTNGRPDREPTEWSVDQSTADHPTTVGTDRRPTASARTRPTDRPASRADLRVVRPAGRSTGSAAVNAAMLRELYPTGLPTNDQGAVIVRQIRDRMNWSYDRAVGAVKAYEARADLEEDERALAVAA